jgi:hypothetical protein
MTENEKLILCHVQNVAHRFGAWRGSLPALVEFIGHSMHGALRPHDIERYIRREETQKELSARWEVGLWRASDKSWRLISLSVNPDPEVAGQRLNEYPHSSDQCRWCLINEGVLAPYDLKPELNLRREVVPNSRLHPQCMRPWSQLRALAEQQK